MGLLLGEEILQAAPVLSPGNVLYKHLKTLVPFIHALLKYIGEIELDRLPLLALALPF